MISKDKKFLIVGLGLIGGSFAKGLKKVGYQVGAIDIDEASITYALENNIIDSGKVVVEKEYLESFDIVIMCLYPALEYEWLKNYQSLFKPGTLIFDVAGVKGESANKIRDLISDDLQMVFAHPMAGREVSGVCNSDDTIFKKANFIIVPSEKNTKEALEIVEEVGQILGFKRISYLSVEEHDDMIGFVSQLTHVIAISLMTCNDDKNLQNYTGDSFRDLTRIAKINENMWTELFIENKQKLIENFDEFIVQMEYIKSLISEEESEKLKEVMRYSTARRKLFDKE